MGSNRVVGCLFILMVSVSSGFAQVLGFSLPEGKSRIQFPIEVYNNLVVVPIVLNGQLPLKFILDTGVRTAILTEKAYSDILNLPYSRKYTIAGPGGEKMVDAYVTNNVTLDMPGVHGQGHAMLVLEKDYLELRNYMGTDVHGILGYELFSRFIVKIDYERKLLTLMLPDRFKPNKRFKWIPITVEDTKPYAIVGLQMNDTTSLSAKLLVDSGASHGIFLETNSNPKIVVPPKHVSAVIGRGLGGEITGEIGRIKSLELGSYSIHGVIANFPDVESYLDTLKSSRTVFRNGSIGGDMLSRFTVIFNFPGERLYLKKNASLKKEFYFSLSGLTIRARGARLRSFEISDVRENSLAAKADIRKGDRILTVNGLNVEELDLNVINGLLNSKPGKKITLQIQRDGVKSRREFRLENII
jgi:hypothetical protein